MVRAMAITTMVVVMLLLLLLLLLKRTVTLMLFLHFLDDRWLRNDDGRTVDFAVVDVVAVVEENIVWRRHKGYNVGFCFVPVFCRWKTKRDFVRLVLVKCQSEKRKEGQLLKNMLLERNKKKSFVYDVLYQTNSSEGAHREN